MQEKLDNTPMIHFARLILIIALFSAMLNKAPHANAADTLQGTASAVVDFAQFKGFVDSGDFISAFEDEVRSFYKKDEYESTDGYTARIKSGPTLKRLSWNSHYHFVMSDADIKYDADREAFIVGRVQTYSRLGEQLVISDVLDSKNTYQWIHILRVIDSEGAYEGQNAFGVGAQVKRVVGRDLYAKVKTLSLTNQTYHYGYNAKSNILFRDKSVYVEPIKEHLGSARSCPKNIVIAARLSKDSESILGKKVALGVHRSPELRSPLDVAIAAVEIPMELARMDLVCTDTGVVVGSFDFSKAPERKVILPNLDGR